MSRLSKMWSVHTSTNHGVGFTVLWILCIQEFQKWNQQTNEWEKPIFVRFRNLLYGESISCWWHQLSRQTLGVKRLLFQITPLNQLFTSNNIFLRNSGLNANKRSSTTTLFHYFKSNCESFSSLIWKVF